MDTVHLQAHIFPNTRDLILYIGARVKKEDLNQEVSHGAAFPC